MLSTGLEQNPEKTIDEMEAFVHRKLNELNGVLMHASFPKFTHAGGRLFRIVSAALVYDKVAPCIHLEGKMQEEGEDILLDISWKELGLKTETKAESFEIQMDGLLFSRCLPKNLFDEDQRRSLLMSSFALLVIEDAMKIKKESFCKPMC